MAKHHAKFG